MKPFSNLKYHKSIKIGIVLIGLLLTIELLIGYFYFQRSWEKGIAVQWFANRVGQKIFRSDTPHNRVLDQASYKKHFVKLVELSKELDFELIILYIPQVDAHLFSSKKAFFHELAKLHNLTFIDLSSEFSNYPKYWLYNLPSDSHLSRFGHIQVSSYVRGFLEEDDMQLDYYNNDEVFGPHPLNVDTVDRYNELAFRVQTNDNGFRMGLEIVKNKGLILALGDSFTFGTGVNTVDAFPNLLNEALATKNILNAGLPGTSLKEQSKYLEKINGKFKFDKLLLQVLDNDVK